MKLPPHLQCELDYLIPHEVIEACELARFDIDLLILGKSCQGVWPSMRLHVDGDVVWEGTVNSEQHISVFRSLDISHEHVDLWIELYGKQDHSGTLVDSADQVLENQGITVKKIMVNDIDLVANNAIYNFGHYHMRLSADKYRHFQAHGHDTGPNHSLDMFENGEWRLRFGVPVIRSIAKTVSPQRTHIKWPDNNLLMAIIEKCDNVARLQQQMEERQKNEDR